MRRWMLLAASIALGVSVMGCSRGPDETALRAEIQGKLDQRFKPGLFGLVGLRRQGSSPLPSSESGASRLAVYYNASLKLTQNYDFGAWEGLSPATLAQVLGATEKGLFGVKTGETRPGEVIKVYGSSTYEWAGDRWQTVQTTARGVGRPSAPGNAAPPSQSKLLINKLAALVDLPPPGPSSQDEAVISEELERALQTITVRRERENHVFVFASGPAEGEYHPIAESVVARVTRTRQSIKMRNLSTQGSVENARLIGGNQADYALIQSNVAAMAFAGDPPFGRNNAATSLRALGSLFPEPLHIVVSASSSIRTIADLRGKRVALGSRESGTRADGLAVLAAHGLGVNDLAATQDAALEAAAAALRAGRLDAFFTTVGVPTRELQRLAARFPIRLVSLDVTGVERLVTQSPGLIRFVIPANTYPGQSENVTTVAATALLVTRSDVPDADAEAIVRVVFDNPDYLSAGSAQGTKISRRSGLRGITIPMHPGASRYFAPPSGSAAVPR